MKLKSALATLALFVRSVCNADTGRLIARSSELHVVEFAKAAAIPCLRHFCQLLLSDIKRSENFC